MKVLCAGDHHFDKSSRWDECRRIHNWMFELAVRERIDLFISCGDIYERASLPEERIAVAEWLCAMAEQCPVLVVKGNHDTRRDLELLGKLEAPHRIVVEEAAGVHYFGDLAVAAVAWPERARIIAHARELDACAEPLAQDALRDVLRGLGERLRALPAAWRTMAVGHFMVDGAVVSTGQPLIGQAMNVSLSDLALLNTGLIVMGHIHKSQAWTHGTTEILYTGSPYRTAFGELEKKSVVLANLDEHAYGYQRVETPCAAMYLVDQEWDDGWCGLLDLPPDIDGAEIRFRYAVEPDARASARAAVGPIVDGWYAAGAINVQIEECVRTTTIARAPEVAQAKSLGDKLVALWDARGTMPEEPRRSALLSMAAELESEGVT